MQTTVLVSRKFSFDPATQPELLEELRSLRSRGFDVYGNVDLDGDGDGDDRRQDEAVGSLQPVAAVTRSPIVSELDELASLGLGYTDIARLIGVCVESVRIWRDGGLPAARNADEVRSLLKRARKLPKGSTRLRDESRGIKAATERHKQAAKSRGETVLALTDDQILEVAMLRESGEKIEAIAEKFGVSAPTVSRVLRVFA